MAKGLNLKAVLSLESKNFKQGLNDIKRQLNGFKNFVKSAFALGSITAFSKQMVQVGADFENAMAKVQAVSNATTKEFQAMQKEAQRLGASTKYTATEAAGALENLTRNGLKAADATKALSKVLQLAQANAIDLATAADIVTNTMNAFGLSVNELQRVNDVMSSTAANAATNINDLYEAMSVAGPYAKIMNATIEETAAAIGTLANMGIKGSNAGKTLAAMYQRLSAITPKAAKELDKYGLDLDEAKIKTQDLATTLKQLNESGIGNSVEALSNLFGKNYAGNIAQLINSVGDFNTMLNVTANSAGTTERMFNQGVGSVRKELDTLKSSYEGLLISISQKTSGVVKGAIRLLQNLITNFKSVGGTIMNIASVAVPLLGANITKLVRVIKTAATETAAATALAGGWITAIASLVTWVGTALVGAWNRANQATKEAAEKMAEFQRESDRVKGKMDDLLGTLGTGKTDPGTIAYIVNQLTQEFPEFANAIIAAGEAVNRDKNWDEFKEKLERIQRIQDAIKEREVKQEEYDTKTQQLGEDLFKMSGIRGGMIYDSSYNNKSNPFDYRGMTSDVWVRNINNAIRRSMKENGKGSKDEFKDVLDRVAKIITENTDLDTAAKKFADELKKEGISIPNPDWELKEYIAAVRGGTTKSGVGSIGIGVEKAGTESIRQTGREVASLDSAIVADSIAAAESEFNDKIDNATDKLSKNFISKEEYRRQTSEAVSSYDAALHKAIGVELPEKYTTQLEELYRKYPAPKPSPFGGGAGGSGGGSTIETDADKVKAALKDYNEELHKLGSRLEAGTIDDFREQVERLQEKTVETITSFSDFETILEGLGTEASTAFKELMIAYKGIKGRDAAAKSAAQLDKNIKDTQTQYGELGKYNLPQKGTRNSLWDFEKKGSEILSEQVKIEFDYSEALQRLVHDLEEAIENGRFDNIKGDALDVLAEIKDAANEASLAADNLQKKLTLAEATEKLEELEKQMRDLASNTLSELSTVFDRLYSAVQGIAEAFGEELEWEGLEKVIKLIDSAVQIFQLFKTVIDAVRAAEELAQRKRDMAAAKQIAENAAIATSEGTKAAAEGAAAAAGGASAVASVPVVGPVLAVAAVAAIVAAIIAGMNKFATGGIVGGTSYSGDHQLIRANSGEMVLNKSQQSTLFDILNGKTSTGGQVEFKIRGSDLIGAINNENMRRRG